LKVLELVASGKPSIQNSTEFSRTLYYFVLFCYILPSFQIFKIFQIACLHKDAPENFAKFNQILMQGAAFCSTLNFKLRSFIVKESKCIFYQLLYMKIEKVELKTQPAPTPGGSGSNWPTCVLGWGGRRLGRGMVAYHG